MAAGQLYDPRRIPQSQPGSGWTLLTGPEVRVHVWGRTLGPYQIYVTRYALDWWDIEITRGIRRIKEDQASSGTAAFAKVNFWWWHQKESQTEPQMEKAS